MGEAIGELYPAAVGGRESAPAGWCRRAPSSSGTGIAAVRGVAVEGRGALLVNLSGRRQGLAAECRAVVRRDAGLGVGAAIRAGHRPARQGPSLDEPDRRVHWACRRARSTVCPAEARRALRGPPRRCRRPGLAARPLKHACPRSDQGSDEPRFRRRAHQDGRDPGLGRPPDAGLPARRSACGGASCRWTTTRRSTRRTHGTSSTRSSTTLSASASRTSSSSTSHTRSPAWPASASTASSSAARSRPPSATSRTEIQTLESLGLPPVLRGVHPKPRGLRAGHRPHRLRQVHLAGLDDRRASTSEREEHILTIEDPIEFLHSTRSASSTSARSAPTRSTSRSP